MKKLVVMLFLMSISSLMFTVRAQKIPVSGQEGNKAIISYDGNMYLWRPFDRNVGLTVYGSKYRKAESRMTWGKVLSMGVAPAFLATSVYAFAQKNGDLAGALLLIPTGTALGALWRRGRKEIDAMIDDYSKNYAPKPVSPSLTAGPTANGVGLAFNF